MVQNSTVTKVVDEIQATASRWEVKAQLNADWVLYNFYKEDADDFRRVAKLVQEGKLHDARRAARQLDTAVREALPDSFFDLLEDNDIEWY